MDCRHVPLLFYHAILVVRSKAISGMQRILPDDKVGPVIVFQFRGGQTKQRGRAPTVWGVGRWRPGAQGKHVSNGGTGPTNTVGPNEKGRELFGMGVGAGAEKKKNKAKVGGSLRRAGPPAGPWPKNHQ